MKFGKNANMNGKWTWVELDEEEVEKALDELLEINYKQMRLCMHKSSEMELNDKQKFSVSKTLLEKNGIASYTYLNNILDKKISDLRNKRHFKSFRKPDFKKAEEVAEKKLSEQPKKPTEPSMIDKAFKEDK